jgi:hypothetical protein
LSKKKRTPEVARQDKQGKKLLSQWNELMTYDNTNNATPSIIGVSWQPIICISTSHLPIAVAVGPTRNRQNKHQVNSSTHPNTVVHAF